MPCGTSTGCVRHRKAPITALVKLSTGNDACRRLCGAQTQPCLHTPPSSRSQTHILNTSSFRMTRQPQLEDLLPMICAAHILPFATPRTHVYPFCICADCVRGDSARCGTHIPRLTSPHNRPPSSTPRPLTAQTPPSSPSQIQRNGLLHTYTVTPLLFQLCGYPATPPPP